MAAPIKTVHQTMHQPLHQIVPPDAMHLASRIAHRCHRTVLLLAIACWTSTPSALARETPPPAYQLAAYRAGVPPAVLYAVALQESGTLWRKRLIPWPWTLNVAGTPQRYATRMAACTGLRQALQRTPAHRIDAGLGQVNLGHQTHRYKQPCELLDPYRNLAIAAQILREQHTPGEDWLLAIGRYHRPAGGAPAARYRHHVRRHLIRVLGTDVSVTALQATTP
jgi:soluble lytic murein transglycosylase-like protein